MAFFPIIPIAPGVPALLRNPLAPLPSIVQLVEDVIFGFAGVLDPQWGVFQDGFPVVTPDSIGAFEYRQDWRLSDYPVEQGAFESYNKVSTPFDSRVRLVSGGDVANRQELLDDVAAIAGTTQLYDIVTPEEIYTGVNVTGYSYRRTASNGMGLIIIELRFLEIRVTATAAFSNTQAPSGAGTTNDGTVQPQAPSGSQLEQLGGFF